MNRLDAFKAMERLRKDAHGQIDKLFDKVILSIHGMDGLAEERNVIPFMADPARFKGEKPTVLYFSDGRVEKISTWRKMAAMILQDCGSIPRCRERLMRWGHVLHGPQRALFSSEPSALNVPLKVTEDLYFEGKFDTEFLFKQLTQALEIAGYDYTGIAVELQGPGEEQTSEPEQDEESGPTMSM